MNGRHILGLAVLFAISGCGSNKAVQSDIDATYSQLIPLQSGHAPVNGIQMYYEVHGREDGVPLVLLHGGGSTIEVTFGRTLPCFA